MQAGRIVERGTHDDLSADQTSAYHLLLSLQAQASQQLQPSARARSLRRDGSMRSRRALTASLSIDATQWAVARSGSLPRESTADSTSKLEPVVENAAHIAPLYSPRTYTAPMHTAPDWSAISPRVVGSGRHRFLGTPGGASPRDAYSDAFAPMHTAAGTRVPTADLVASTAEFRLLPNAMSHAASALSAGLSGASPGLNYLAPLPAAVDTPRRSSLGHAHSWGCSSTPAKEHAVAYVAAAGVNQHSVKLPQAAGGPPRKRAGVDEEEDSCSSGADAHSDADEAEQVRALAQISSSAVVVSLVMPQSFSDASMLPAYG